MNERKWIATGNLAWRRSALPSPPAANHPWELVQELVELEIGNWDATPVNSTWRPIPILPPNPPPPTLSELLGELLAAPFDLFPPQTPPPHTNNQPPNPTAHQEHREHRELQG